MTGDRYHKDTLRCVERTPTGLGERRARHSYMTHPPQGDGYKQPWCVRCGVCRHCLGVGRTKERDVFIVDGESTQATKLCSQCQGMGRKDYR